MKNLIEYKRILDKGYRIIEVNTREFTYDINTKDKTIMIPQLKEKSKLIELLNDVWEKIK